MINWQWHDMHVHTRPHSPDAHWRATLPTMLKIAAKNGVWLVGLANHYFPPTKFKIFQKLRQQIVKATPTGMTVLVGAEVCVLDSEGNTILTPDKVDELDFVLAGPHHFKQRWVEKPPYGNAVEFVEQQHQSLLNVVKNPLINGLAHPWMINIQHSHNRWGFSPADFLAAWSETHFAELGQLAKIHQTAIEIGMGIHFTADYQGEQFWQAYRHGLQIIRECGAKFYFGSDAHHRHVIARLDWLTPTLKSLAFTPDDIISPLDWVQQKS